MWQVKNKSLNKKFVFKDFKQASGFMQSVATFAEEINHHPKWLNQWNQVEIWLSTHSKKDQITDKDHRLANKIDIISKDYQ